MIINERFIEIVGKGARETLYIDLLTVTAIEVIDNCGVMRLIFRRDPYSTLEVEVYNTYNHKALFDAWAKVRGEVSITPEEVQNIWQQMQRRYWG